MAPSNAETAVVKAAQENLNVLDKETNDFRLLSALLAHAPTVEGLRVIAEDINDASGQPNGLAYLAEFYRTGLFLPSESI